MIRFTTSTLRRWPMLALATLLAAAVMQPTLSDARPRRAATRLVPVAARVTPGTGGSVIIGNPAATVRVTEWASYTCPHCAHFAEEGDGALKRTYLPGGRVNFEVRHLVRDPVDFAMAVAAHCGGMGGFIGRHEALMAAQSSIIARVQALPQARMDAWREGVPTARLRRVADDAGVIALLRARGATAAQVDQCYADEALQRRLIEMTNAASALGINGTPSFAINGSILPEVYSWDALRPRIDAALAPARP
jgi:protein-disulfide isomerase